MACATRGGTFRPDSMARSLLGPPCVCSARGDMPHIICVCTAGCVGVRATCNARGGVCARVLVYVCMLCVCAGVHVCVCVCARAHVRVCACASVVYVYVRVCLCTCLRDCCVR